MKKKFKKSTVIICIVVIALLGIIGSSSDSDDKKDIVTTSTNSDNKDSDSDDKKDNESKNSDNEDITNTDNESSSTSITIEKQPLIDQNDIIITATEYTTDSIFGDGIKILIENNSNTDVLIGCNALIVNDYMINDLFGTSVAAGKKTNETIYLSSSELDAAGIDTVGQIELYFSVSDDSTYQNLFDTDCITIQTSEYANMDTTPNDDGTELYNENGIKIIGKTVDENSFWGKAILLYCENTSGRNVGISVDDMSINGFMMSPFFSTTVYDTKKSIDDITIFSSDLEQNGIETIEDVELKFRIYDADSYNTIDESEPITFKAE